MLRQQRCLLPGFGTQGFDLILLDELTPPQLVNLSVQITDVTHGESPKQSMSVSPLASLSAACCYRHRPFLVSPHTLNLSHTHRQTETHKADSAGPLWAKTPVDDENTVL